MGLINSSIHNVRADTLASILLVRVSRGARLGVRETSQSPSSVLLRSVKLGLAVLLDVRNLEACQPKSLSQAELGPTRESTYIGVASEGLDLIGSQRSGESAKSVEDVVCLGSNG